MENNKLVLFGLVLLAGVFTIIAVQNGFIGLPESTNEGLEYTASVCTYTTGDFEGRETPSSNGVMEVVSCSHNTLFGTGKNMTRTALALGSTVPITNITMCNSTNASFCGTPTTAALDEFNQFRGCGMDGAIGTYGVGDIEGNWTVGHTFTSSCDGVRTNVTRLGNSSTFFAGNSFTSVNLSNSDQLTVNWSIGVS